MRFENAEAEDYYYELQKKFGYFHANFGNSIISMEDLLDLRESIIEMENLRKG